MCLPASSRSYPAYLKSKGYVPTTIKNMVINVVSFYKHVEHAFLKLSKLKTEDFGRVLYELKRLQAEIRRDVVVRQQRVKQKKTGELCLCFLGTFQIPFKTKEPYRFWQGLILLPSPQSPSWIQSKSLLS